LEILFKAQLALVESAELVDLVLVLAPDFDFLRCGLLVRLGELKGC